MRAEKKSFITVLSSLGIPDLGPKACELIIKSGLNTFDKIMEAAVKKDYDIFTSINGIGIKTAETVIQYFNDPVFINKVLKLKKAGLNFRL